MHSSNQSAHDVGAACVRVKHKSWFATHCTGVSVINTTAMGVTVVLILATLVGSGRTYGLLLATARITKTHSWLLRDTTAAVLASIVLCVMVVVRALLLSEDVDTVWGLLADGHSELVNVCKLVLGGPVSFGQGAPKNNI